MKDEAEDITEITELEELPGVGSGTAEKIRNAGFGDVLSVALTMPNTLAEACDLKYSDACKIVHSAKQHIKLKPLETADVVKERRDKIQRIKIGVKDFDDLLGGGVEPGAITEFYGEFSTGKTQICHQLCVNVQLPVEKGGLEGEAVYVDTENTFRPERIVAMANALKLDPNDVLKKIHVIRANSAGHQVIIGERLKELTNDINVKLLVVDSLTAHFRAEFAGRGVLQDRQQSLSKYIHNLLRFADERNCVVAATNQVVADPGKMFGDPNKPAGGNIVAHNMMFRVYLRKGQKGKKVAKLVDAPNLPESEALFSLTEKGIRD